MCFELTVKVLDQNMKPILIIEPIINPELWKLISLFHTFQYLKV